MLALLFKILKQSFLKVLKSGHRLAFAGRGLNKVANESWKVPLLKEMSITDALLERSVRWGLCIGNCKYSGGSFTKKSSVSKLKNAKLSIFQRR